MSVKAGIHIDLTGVDKAFVELVKELDDKSAKKEVNKLLREALRPAQQRLRAMTAQDEGDMKRSTSIVGVRTGGGRSRTQAGAMQLRYNFKKARHAVFQVRGTKYIKARDTFTKLNAEIGAQTQANFQTAYKAYLNKAMKRITRLANKSVKK